MRNVYLVYRKIWCSDKYIVQIFTKERDAKEAASGSAELAYIWLHDYWDGGGGWLITRWNGLDIDYSPLVMSFKLPDDSVTGFVHKGNEKPWSLLFDAVWKSEQRMPKWLKDLGVKVVRDA